MSAGCIHLPPCRELRRRIRHEEDESLFQLGLHDAGRLTHGIGRAFDKVNDQQQYRVAIQLAKIWLEFWLEKRLEIPF